MAFILPREKPCREDLKGIQSPCRSSTDLLCKGEFYTKYSMFRKNIRTRVTLYPWLSRFDIHLSCNSNYHNFTKIYRYSTCICNTYSTCLCSLYLGEIEFRKQESTCNRGQMQLVTFPSQLCTKEHSSSPLKICFTKTLHPVKSSLHCHSFLKRHNVFILLHAVNGLGNKDYLLKQLPPKASP